MEQWQEYVKQDTSLKCWFVKKHKDAEDSEEFKKVTEYDAVFVSATMWKTFENANPIHTILWSRIIMDEADTIAVTIGHERIQARFYWFISASWMNLIFSGGAYFNMDGVQPPTNIPDPVVHFMKQFYESSYFNVSGSRNTFVKKLCGDNQINSYNTSLLNAVTFQATRVLIRNTEDFIRKSFDIPLISHIYRLCQAPSNIRVLNEMISPEMMERLNAGDAVGALEMLGMSAKSVNDVATAVTESIRKELDNLVKTYEFKKTMDYHSTYAKQKALEHYEDKIARIQSRIEAIESRVKNTTDQTCPICFCELNPPSVTPCCRNLFCFGCICESIKARSACPLCREPIHVKNIQVVGDSIVGNSDTPKEAPLLSKKDAFIRLIEENEKARILTFSGYDATFFELSEILEAKGIPYATLNGTNARITKLIKDFEKGKYRVLFLNSRNMGAGLNIKPATHIILYHRMPVETQNQIIGRAIRLGRTEPLTVIHLMHGNEMDSATVVPTISAPLDIAVQDSENDNLINHL
jgi:rubrerythrin